jgi:hypothetical protein
VGDFREFFMKKAEGEKSKRLERALALIFEQRIKKRTPSNYFPRVFDFFPGFS